MDKLEGAKNRTAAEEWFGVICFESVLSILYVVRANIAAHPFAAELPRNRHHFYICRLFQDFRMRRKRLHDQDNMYLSAVRSAKKKIY